MSNALIRKLDLSGFLQDADRDILRGLTARTRPVERQKDLIREDDQPNDVFLIVEGFACRYKMMPAGRRHIMAVLVPGDFCDLHVSILGRMDHSIATLSPCRVVNIPRATIEDLTNNHPRITRALWWATLTDEAVLREWLANMGQREANRQTAHLFCELLFRLRSVGLARDNTFLLPLTQKDLGDVLGMSNVHVNRILQELRSDGLINLVGKTLEIPDPSRLMAYCAFNPNYLHLTPRFRDASVADAPENPNRGVPASEP